MNMKSIAAIALTVIAGSGLAYAGDDRKCGAGSCSKKTQSAEAAKADASCSKKEAPAAAPEASCSKKEAAPAKPEASCSKKTSDSNP